MDFQHYQTADGRVLRAVNVVDEFTREMLGDARLRLSASVATTVPPHVWSS